MKDCICDDCHIIKSCAGNQCKDLKSIKAALAFLLTKMKDAEIDTAVSSTGSKYSITEEYQSILDDLIE